jgi:hypothetical protein
MLRAPTVSLAAAPNLGAFATSSSTTTFILFVVLDVRIDQQLNGIDPSRDVVSLTRGFTITVLITIAASSAPGAA